MSAVGGKADTTRTQVEVRFWPVFDPKPIPGAYYRRARGFFFCDARSVHWLAKQIGIRM